MQKELLKHYSCFINGLYKNWNIKLFVEVPLRLGISLNQERFHELETELKRKRIRKNRIFKHLFLARPMISVFIRKKE
ncbi:hypothetical protein BXU10_16670 [Flavobacterium sp. LM4]|nr:hypothetical protein BXU10_16670 [Flavobacterium sp. LM4]